MERQSEEMMETLQAILNQTQDGTSLPSDVSRQETEQWKADTANKGTKKPREGYDCKLCGNKEGHYKICEDGEMKFVYCKCKATRDNIRRLRKSGLQDVITEYALNKFEPKDDWQKGMLDMAHEFLKEPNGKNWFYLGGQPGAGKTHICTGIVRELLYAGKEVRYLTWRDFIKSLHGKMGQPDYDDFLDEYARAEVLYIDDLFKDSKPPTKFETQIAYLIINNRYISPKLITIISCEYHPQQLLSIDEAMGSRIYERSKKFVMYIEPDGKKNYRMNGEIRVV